MYAIIESGGKQFKVAEGEAIKIDKIDNKKSVTFNNVLMVSDGETVSFGDPYIKSAKVSADVIATEKDKKGAGIPSEDQKEPQEAAWTQAAVYVGKDQKNSA